MHINARILGWYKVRCPSSDLLLRGSGDTPQDSYFSTGSSNQRKSQKEREQEEVIYESGKVVPTGQ